MHRPPSNWLVGAVILCFVAGQAQAHDGLDEQVERVSRRIFEDPDNASLYLKRGALHRLHADWTAALADFDRAEALDPTAVEVQPARARVLVESGRPAEALPILHAYCAAHPVDGRAHLTRARALARLHRLAKSTEAYAVAVRTLESPGPDIYFEWAKTHLAIGDGGLGPAIRVLDQGIARLGRAAALHRYVVELEVRARRYDDALARVDQLLLRSRRKDQWLALRGDILVDAERFDDAAHAYLDALRAIEFLPARIRGTPATRERYQAVRAALEELRERAVSP